jgi:putative oxidoreductase
MQRLFSTFPNSWPGAALVLLRVTAAVPMSSGVLSVLCGVPRVSFFGSEVVGGALAICLIGGFLTPFAAAAEVLLEISMMVGTADVSLAPALLAVIGVSVLMLGPGAWSVDALIFGRRRIDLPRE